MLFQTYHVIVVVVLIFVTIIVLISIIAIIFIISVIAIIVIKNNNLPNDSDTHEMFHDIILQRSRWLLLKGTRAWKC